MLVLRDQSFYHYKYKQVKSVETLVENRVLREFIQFYQTGEWTNKNHESVIVVKDIAHYLKNSSYQILREKHNNPTARLNVDFKVFPHYIQLDTHATISGGSQAASWVEIQLTADEYKILHQTEIYTSDFFQISDNKFSIIVPVQTYEGSFSTATLTFIIEGQVLSYDPYTFNEDSNLKKLSTISIGQNQIEISFLVK